ncbi:hypothetical protein MASR2M117_26400 [Paludibacter sp.]
MREDWIECNLDEVCEVLDNLRKPINSNERSERIKGKDIEELFPYYGATGQVGYIDNYLTDGNYVLLGEDAAPFLDFTKDVAYKITGKTWVNNHAHILKSYFNDDYLLHYLNQFQYRDYVTGTTRLKLTQGALKRMPFKLAPLPIQRAIVSKIEALFSDLDNGIANFKKAQEQLKVYRQAVLKKAFEGELTSVLFNEWEYSTLKESVKFSQGIQVDVNLQSENRNKDSVRFLRIIDFTQGNEPARYINNPGEKYIVYKNDVSLVRYGASTGFVCSNLEGAIANNLFRVIPIKPIEKKYLYYFLCSPLFQNIISQSVKGAAMPAISFGLINDVVLPFPKNISEQTQIVQEIESRLSVCDKMEQSINESIEKAEALRQSILKKAFEGKLLSEAEIEQCKKEADYEPASELLKKIQAEKLAKEQEKKKKPKTKK